MATTTVSDKAQRLIRTVCGEEYGDGELVTEIAHDYAEPGYRLSSENGLVVFGNWNPKRFPRDGEPPLTKAESLPVRLADALSNVGADLEWLDEWTNCADCYRAMRTVENSYSWKMNGAWVEDAGYVCSECLRGDLESSLEDYINNSANCVTWCSGSDLEGLGFVQYIPGNPQTYESGWHAGQDDDPKKVLEVIRKWDDDEETLQVVFLLDESSQFYIKWSAYSRHTED
jgi:hypothetical protein